MSKRPISSINMCEKHRDRKNYPINECPACTRAIINAHQTRILVKLFPVTFSEDRYVRQAVGVRKKDVGEPKKVRATRTKSTANRAGSLPQSKGATPRKRRALGSYRRKTGG